MYSIIYGWEIVTAGSCRIRLGGCVNRILIYAYPRKREQIVHGDTLVCLTMRASMVQARRAFTSWHESWGWGCCDARRFSRDLFPPFLTSVSCSRIWFPLFPYLKPVMPTGMPPSFLSPSREFGSTFGPEGGSNMSSNPTHHFRRSHRCPLPPSAPQKVASFLPWFRL